jgi:hypothetical protein
VNRYRLRDASAPTNTMFRQRAAKQAAHLLQHLRPAADTQRCRGRKPVGWHLMLDTGGDLALEED